MALIEFRNVGKWVKDGKRRRWLFRHIDLRLPSKGLFAIYGPSGCGKSTFLSLVSGLSKPDEGKILVKGISPSSLPSEKEASFRRKEIGMVFQHYNLLGNLSLLENVALPKSFASSRNEGFKKGNELLKAFGLDRIKEQMPEEASGGEKQRAAICRALINDPAILLCDEPTGALNEASSETVMKWLKEISKERLVILVSHNRKMMDRYADWLWSFGEPFLCDDALKRERGKAAKREMTSKSWEMPFLKRRLRKHLAKNLICVAVASLGIVSGLLSIGYFHGKDKASYQQAISSPDYRVLRLQTESKVSFASSPLHLIEIRRPSNEECAESLDGKAEIGFDFSYFIPQSSPFVFDGFNKDVVSLSPVYSLDAKRINLRENFEACLVNDSFAKRYPEIGVGNEIYVPHCYEVESASGEKEKICVDFKFQIVGIASDFPFLSSPKIYYSYSAYENRFRSEILPDGQSVYECVEQAADNSSYSSFSLLAFFQSEEAADDFYQAHKEGGEGLKASSTLRSAIESFSLLSDGVSKSLLAFSLISLLSVAVVMAMCNYSSFVDERKENAILICLGAGKRGVNEISLMESFFCGLVTGAMALACSPLASWVGNALFREKFGLENLIEIPMTKWFGIPFLLPFLILLFSTLFNLVCAYLPLRKANSGNLSEELRDE